MNKLLAFAFAFIILSSLASAWDFDNRLSVDRDNIITFRDSILGIPTTKVADAKLETPQVNFVAAGKDVMVASFWVNLSDAEYRNWISKIETYDLKNNWKEVDKTFTIKKRTYEMKQVMTYKQNCTTIPLQNRLYPEQTQSCKEVEDRLVLKQVEVWSKIEDNSIRGGYTYIGVFTDVGVNERMEWIPTMFGVRNTAWATWDSTLSTGLTSYYNMNTGTGTNFYDSIGLFNGTLNAGANYTSGILGNATHFDGTDDNGNTTAVLSIGSSAKTVAFWARPLAATQTKWMFDSGGLAGVAGSFYGIGLSSGNLYFYGFSGADLDCTPAALNVSIWNLVAIEYDGAVIRCYLNGNNVMNKSYTLVYNSTSYKTVLAQRSPAYGSNFFNGDIDELGIWNRSLSATEIKTLWANGTGMSYSSIAPIPSGSIRITLTSPVDGYITNRTSPTQFNYTITPNMANITNSTLTFSHRTIPATLSVFNNSFALSNSSQNFSYTYTGALLEGNWTWNVVGCYINQTFGHSCNNTVANYTFIVDLTRPSIVIDYPNGTYLVNTVPLNYTVRDTNRGACWYYTSDNSTNVSLPGCTNTTITLSGGGYKTVTVYANDTAGNFNNSTKTFALDIISLSFRNNTYETDRERFGLSYTNISGIPISATLTYDGVDYVTTADAIGSGNYVSNKTLDISLTNSTINKTFYWTIDYFGGGSATTAVLNQTVSPIHLEQCNATYTVQTRNYTVYDEGNLAKIYNFAFYSTINYWLGSGVYYKTLSISNPFINETRLCISPGSETFIANGIIQYGDNNLSYTTRQDYLIQSNLDNVSQDKYLYLLDNDDSTTFILKVQDFTQTPVVGAYITIQRYYPGTNTYQTIQTAQTDEDGETLGFLKTETVEYRFIITNSSGYALKITDKAVVFGKTVPYTLLFTVGEIIGIPWEEFEDRSGLNTSLTYNNNTKMVGYIYVDANSSFVSSRLYVEKTNPSGLPTIICNVTSTSSSNLLSCDLSAYNESSFKAVGFNTRYISGQNTELSTNVIIVQIDNIIDIFGNEGLFWAWVIILTSALTMLYNPIAGMWVVTAATIFVRVIGLAKFGMIWIFGLIVLSIMVSMMLKPKGGFQ